MDGNFDASELIGTTTGTTFAYSLDIDGAIYFEVKGRAIIGEEKSEGPTSDGAFVDFEQAEYSGSEGSWGGNSFYDNSDLKIERSTNYAHHLAGGF